MKYYNINIYSWKIALYFVCFEGIYWFIGNRVIQYVKYNGLVIPKLPLLEELMISFIGLLVSIWCFKQFIRHLLIFLIKLKEQ